jgi:hypothetical protein
MKEIHLTREKVALVDDEDFEWLNQWKWCFDGRYAARRLENYGKKIRMHTVILQPTDGMLSDHKNRNELDNQRNNLRVCTKAQNQHNRGKQSNNRSGYKGVDYVASKQKRNKRWYAHIGYNGRNICVGYFLTPKEAAKAYDTKAIELYGKFADTNF